MTITVKIALALSAAFLLGLCVSSFASGIRTGNEDAIVYFGFASFFSGIALLLRGNVAIQDASDMELMLKFTGANAPIRKASNGTKK